jgi:hypothetical protein
MKEVFAAMEDQTNKATLGGMVIPKYTSISIEEFPTTRTGASELSACIQRGIR